MKTAFVVDDCNDTCDMIRTFIEHRGHTVETFSSFDDAIVRIESGFEPCLILIDLHVPSIISAKEFVERCRQKRREAKIFVMSGSTKGAEFAQSLNVEAFLQKPFEVEHVIQEVEKHCNQPSAPSVD